VVATRGDRDHEMSLFFAFRLLRIDLNEVKGCGELAAILEIALILHEMCA